MLLWDAQTSDGQKERFRDNSISGNKKMNKAALLLLIIFFPFVFSCKGEQTRKTERWEGMDSGLLRVYVKLRIPEEIETSDKKFKKNMRKDLAKAAKDRAAHMLISQILAETGDISRVRKLGELILDISENGKIIHDQCFDEYCEAFAEFNLKAMNKTAEIRGINTTPEKTGE